MIPIKETLVSILVMILQKNQKELNKELQVEHVQIDNKLFILLCRDLMTDGCNAAAITDENVFAFVWICLTLA